ncbi:hypothetical protein ACFL59_03150 [Planctomycetota bacterium]
MSESNGKAAPGEAKHNPSNALPKRRAGRVATPGAGMVRKAQKPATPPSSGKIITTARWLVQRCREGETVKLRVTVDPRGAPDGTALTGGIFRKSNVAEDASLHSLEGEIKDGHWTTEWKSETPDEPEGEAGGDPEFVFRVAVEGEEATSPPLVVGGYVGLKTADEEGKPRSVRYRAYLPDDTEFEGETDENGVGVIEPLPSGPLQIQFPVHNDEPGRPGADEVKRADPEGETAVEATDRFKIFGVHTGETYEFAFETCALEAELEIDPDDEKAGDDVYTLFSTDADKTYSQHKTIRDDTIPDDGMLTLRYTDLNPELRYTLLVDLGDDGEPYHLFEEVSYEELAGGAS